MTTLPSEPIRSFDGQYQFLSNFYPSPIQVRGLGVRPQVIRTVEHFFQAMKSLDPNEQQRVLDCPTPSKAMSMGRQVTLREDWETIKRKVMYIGLRAKFTQNPTLEQRLLSTGHRELIEGNHWNDTYWGVSYGVGENHLGKLLMELREELRSS